jgi:hypothetical protein
MSLVSSPSLYGNTRQFVTSFTNNGDERYSVVFADDVNAKNFFYDTWVYLTSSSSKIANIEFDTNQVMSNGQTVLIGFQCDGWTGNWAYTVNQGSATNVKPHWVSKSGTNCNPRSWSQNKWHHVQASFSRDDSGYITYIPVARWGRNQVDVGVQRSQSGPVITPISLMGWVRAGRPFTLTT